MKAALSMIWGSIGRGYSFIGNAPPVRTPACTSSLPLWVICTLQRRYHSSCIGLGPAVCSFGSPHTPLHLTSPDDCHLQNSHGVLDDAIVDMMVRMNTVQSLLMAFTTLSRDFGCQKFLRDVLA